VRFHTAGEAKSAVYDYLVPFDDKSTETSLRPVHTSNIVEATFDFVATNGNNVERNFVLSTMSKQIEHDQFVSTLSKGRNFFRHCCPNRQHCCRKRQQCRSNIVERIVQLVAFDNVASTLLLVWTGLKSLDMLQ